MSDKQLSTILKWTGISILAAMIFGVGSAIIFWNNDGLFMYHWLAVPLVILMMVIGAIKSFREQN